MRKPFIKKTLIILLCLSVVASIIYGCKVYWDILVIQDNAYESIEIEKQKIIKEIEENKQLASETLTEETITAPVQEEEKIDIAPIIEEKSINFLLLGADARKGGFGRADTILVGKYNPNSKKVVIFSIPRDTYVEVPGHGKTKVNHAYAYGKVPLLEVTLENYLDIKFDYYIMVDFQGFRDVIDAMGGIPINVEKDMYWSDSSDGENTMINLKKGNQILNGVDALGYARFRHDGEGDIGRMKRQQTVIHTLINELKNPLNIIQIPSYIKIGGEHLKTDFNADDISHYLSIIAKDMNISIEFDMLSGPGGIASDGIYYFHIPTSEIDRLNEKFKSIE